MDDYTVLVNTCDAYADLWDHFFYLLKVNWPDSIRHKIIINTESVASGVDGERIEFVNMKYDDGDRWGGRVLHCLEKIYTEYVVVLMDDFFLRRPVPQEKFQVALEAMENDSSIACFYLVDIFKETRNDDQYCGYAEIPQWRNYRLNSAPALWRKESLQRYTEASDNPWAWEYFGSCRTNYTNEKFYAVSKMEEPVYDYAHVVYRGKWLGKNILPLTIDYPLRIDFEKRGLINSIDQLPKRSLLWKLQFVLTGFKMVGMDAFKPLIGDVKKYVL